MSTQSAAKTSELRKPDGSRDCRVLKRDADGAFLSSPPIASLGGFHPGALNNSSGAAGSLKKEGDGT